MKTITYEKASETALKVITTHVEETVISINDLLQQKVNIETFRQNETAAYEKKIAELDAEEAKVDALIAEAVGKGVKEDIKSESITR